MGYKSSSKDGVHRNNFRLVIALGLLVLTGFVGWGSYYAVYYFEDVASNGEFQSLAQQVETSTRHSMVRKILAMTSSSNLLGMVCNDPGHWPNCSLPMKSFFNITDPLIDMGEMRTLGFAPILTPDQVPAFEEFAYKTYEEEGYGNLGISSFGKGISSVNATTGDRYHDTKGPGVNNSKHQILTPVLQIGKIAENSGVVMFNLYSQTTRITAIDAMIDCFSGGGRNAECVSITDIIHLVQDKEFRPAVLVIHPVTAFDDPDKLVGLYSLVMNWDTVFSNVVPNFVEGIDIVLTGSDKDYTFNIHDGNTGLKSSDDSHDSKYDSTGRHFQIPFFTGPITYSISIYRSDAFNAKYRTDLPIYACVVAMLVMLFICAFLVTYDQTVQKAVLERELVMDTKRLFVRFISHEMRTPMNIAHLGLKLVTQELVDFIALNMSQETITTEVLRPIMEDWVRIITDIDGSTDTAITVLNDLINYDKIHLNGMTIEPEPLSVWRLLKDTTQTFSVQARQGGIDLKLDIEIDNKNSLSMSIEQKPPLSELCVMADPIKIVQVLRNLLSNALKFSNPSSTVLVSAYYKKGGLGVGDSGSKVIDVTGGNPFTQTGSIVISVKDTGAGISVHNQKSLFQEGIQFRANQLQAGGGSGLGLWITKGIVELHRGIITALSEGEGLGTIFTLELPVGFVNINDSIIDQGRQASLSDLESADGPSRGHTRSIVKTFHKIVPFEDPSTMEVSSRGIPKRKIYNILAVDDSALSLKMCLRTLRRCGYTCYEAVDGLDCLKKYDSLLAEGVAIDVILMDYEMPHMNGMLCYAMLCYAMLCYAMLCYAVLCYAMLCYDMLC
jgi:signal transduction histidine kinase